MSDERPEVRERDALPEVIGLCPVNPAEFYVPHGGTCPECDEVLVEYVRADDLEALREAVSFFLVGAPLDEHGRFKDPAREVLYRAAIAPRSEP